MISRHSLALPRICLALKMLYCFGGDEENRTPDPLLARQVLSQLSYAPGFSLFCLPLWVVVGLSGLEPLTSRLSGVRSNQLSYRPVLSSIIGICFVRASSRLVDIPQYHLPALPRPSLHLHDAEN